MENSLNNIVFKNNIIQDSIESNNYTDSTDRQRVKNEDYSEENDNKENSDDISEIIQHQQEVLDNQTLIIHSNQKKQHHKLSHNKDILIENEKNIENNNLAFHLDMKYNIIFKAEEEVAKEQIKENKDNKTESSNNENRNDKKVISYNYTGAKALLDYNYTLYKNRLMNIDLHNSMKTRNKIIMNNLYLSTLIKVNYISKYLNIPELENFYLFLSKNNIYLEKICKLGNNSTFNSRYTINNPSSMLTNKLHTNNTINFSINKTKISNKGIFNNNNNNQKLLYDLDLLGFTNKQDKYGLEINNNSNRKSRLNFTVENYFLLNEQISKHSNASTCANSNDIDDYSYIIDSKFSYLKNKMILSNGFLSNETHISNYYWYLNFYYDYSFISEIYYSKNSNRSFCSSPSISVGLKIKEILLYFKLTLNNSDLLRNNYRSVFNLNKENSTMTVFPIIEIGIRNKFFNISIPITILNYFKYISNKAKGSSSMSKKINVSSNFENDYDNIEDLNKSKKLNQTNSTNLSSCVVSFLKLSYDIAVFTLVNKSISALLSFYNNILYEKHKKILIERHKSKIDCKLMEAIEINKQLLPIAEKNLLREINHNGLVIKFALFGRKSKLVSVYNDSFFVDYDNSDNCVYIRNKFLKKTYSEVIDVTVPIISFVKTKKEKKENDSKDKDKDNLSFKNDNKSNEECEQCGYIDLYCTCYISYVELDLRINHIESTLGFYNPMFPVNYNNNENTYNSGFNKQEDIEEEDSNSSPWLLTCYSYKGKNYVLFKKSGRIINLP